MRTKKIEKKLADEIASETPDVLSSILARCTPEEQEKITPVADAKPTSRKWLKAMYATAAMLVLFIGGYLGIGQYRQAWAAEYSVTLEAGAGVRLDVSKTGKVVSAAGLDAKGEAAVNAAQSEEKLRGKQLDAAVKAVVSAMAADGTISGQGAVLVTVTGPDADKNAATKEAVTKIVTDTLKRSGINASVLGQIAARSEELTALAEKYGVSEGRAALIEQIAENEPGLTEREIAKLELGALAVLTENLGAEASASVRAGDAAASGYVSADAAAKRACAKAEASLGSAAVTKVNAEVKDGNLVYEVQVQTPAGSAACRVDAKTGEILSWVSDIAAAVTGGSGTGSAAGTSGGTGGDSSADSSGAAAATAPPQSTAGVSANVGIELPIDGQMLIDKLQSGVHSAVDRARQGLESKRN